jgi:HK97 gp10 family phage protein
MTAVKIDTAICDKIIAGLGPKADKVVRETAFRIKDKAMRGAAVDTGAMKSGIYVKSSKGNGYQAAVAAALDKNPDAKVAPDELPDVKEGVAFVAAPLEYSLFQELGTKNMAAHPFLVPAAESERADFERKLKDVGKYG